MSTTLQIEEGEIHPTGGAPAPAPRDQAACCGGPPPKDLADACCALDARARSAGGAGCGCVRSAPPAASPARRCC